LRIGLAAVGWNSADIIIGYPNANRQPQGGHRHDTQQPNEEQAEEQAALDSLEAEADENRGASFGTQIAGRLLRAELKTRTAGTLLSIHHRKG